MRIPRFESEYVPNHVDYCVLAWNYPKHVIQKRIPGPVAHKKLHCDCQITSDPADSNVPGYRVGATNELPGQCLEIIFQLSLREVDSEYQDMMIEVERSPSSSFIRYGEWRFSEESVSP